MEVWEDVAAAVVVVAVLEIGVVAGGVLKSLDCHRIYTPYALMWPSLLKALSVLEVRPSSSVQVYLNSVVTSGPGCQVQSINSEIVDDSAARVTYLLSPNLKTSGYC